MEYIIYKYPIIDNIKVPKGSTLLSTGWQNNKIVAWVLEPKVDNPQMEVIEFKIMGTGWPIPARDLQDFTYLNTIQDTDEGFVWHIFRKH